MKKLCDTIEKDFKRTLWVYILLLIICSTCATLFYMDGKETTFIVGTFFAIIGVLSITAIIHSTYVILKFRKIRKTINKVLDEEE